MPFQATPSSPVAPSFSLSFFLPSGKLVPIKKRRKTAEGGPNTLNEQQELAEEIFASFQQGE